MNNNTLSFEELYDAYIDCLKHKKSTENAFKYMLHEKENLFNLYNELIHNKYVIGRSISFIVTYPKPREVFAADFKDRIVHHLVIKKILPYVEKYSFIDNSYSCRVGKGTLYGIESVKQMIKECSNNYTEDCYILKCDLKSFFMSIDKRILYDKLYKFIKDHNIFPNDESFNFYINLFKLIIFNCPQKNCVIKGDKSLWKQLPKDKSLFYCDEYHGLPIGNLTSQIFANFFLSDFDHYIVDKFKYYGRYVDDFVIISKDKKALADEIPLIQKFLSEKLHVQLHPKKIYLQHFSKGVSFIGGIIKPNRTYILNKTKGKLYLKLHYYLDQYKSNGELSLKELKDLRATLNSYFGLFSKFNTFKLRKKILTSKEFIPLYHYFSTTFEFKKVNLSKKYKNLFYQNFIE